MRWNTSSSNIDRGRFLIVDTLLEDDGGCLSVGCFSISDEKTGEINEFNSGGV